MNNKWKTKTEFFWITKSGTDESINLLVYIINTLLFATFTNPNILLLAKKDSFVVALF